VRSPRQHQHLLAEHLWNDRIGSPTHSSSWRVLCHHCADHSAAGGAHGQPALPAANILPQGFPSKIPIVRASSPRSVQLGRSAPLRSASCALLAKGAQQANRICLSVNRYPRCRASSTSCFTVVCGRFTVAANRAHLHPSAAQGERRSHPRPSASRCRNHRDDTASTTWGTSASVVTHRRHVAPPLQNPPQQQHHIRLRCLRVSKPQRGDDDALGSL